MARNRAVADLLRKEPVGFDSFRFLDIRKVIVSVRFGLAIICSGSMRFGLCFIARRFAEAAGGVEKASRGSRLDADCGGGRGP